MIRTRFQEIKRDIKALLQYPKFDRINSDRKIRVFNVFLHPNLSNDWLCRFVRQCNLPLRDGDLSIFGIYGRKLIIHLNRSKYKIFFNTENTHVKHSYWERFKDNLLDTKCISLALGFDYLTNERYMRFPYWLTTFFKPDETLESIRSKIQQTNQEREQTWRRIKASTLISRLDYFGDRAFFADEVAKVLEIKYAGNFRHNDDDLHGKYGNDKIAYIKQFMFSLCPENSNTNGYVTEKIFHAFEAGCFPIYWGSDNIPEPGIINPEAVIFLKRDGDNSEALQKINRLLNDEDYCKEFASISPFLPGAEYKIYTYFEDLRNKLKQIVK